MLGSELLENSVCLGVAAAAASALWSATSFPQL